MPRPRIRRNGRRDSPPPTRTWRSLLRRPDRDRYFRELGTQDVKRRMSNGLVAVSDENSIAGYYTFAATSLPLTELSAEETRRLPRYALMPAGLIGRLAVDRRFQGRRLAGALILDTAARAARSDPAIFALIVDAKDEGAVAFYEHLRFRRFASRPMTLFLPIATAPAGDRPPPVIKISLASARERGPKRRGPRPPNGAQSICEDGRHRHDTRRQAGHAPGPA